MKEHLVLDITAQNSLITIQVNGLLFTHLRTLQRSGLKMPFNELLVKGENQIKLEISPSGPIADFLNETINIHIYSKFPKYDDAKKVVIFQQSVRPNELTKIKDQETYQYIIKFPYQGFDITPVLSQLSPVTQQEAIAFALHAVSLIENKDLESFANLFYIRKKIFSQAYNEEFEKNFRQQINIFKSTFMSTGLEKMEIENHEFVLTPHVGGKVYSIYIKPDFELDINKSLDKSEILRNLLISKRTRGTPQYSLECSIAKYQGKLIFFI
ncbi:hypothetical protein H0A36_27365 [Endozoicomonas sp. SM1973]|uniref:Uncharacterized protein n=2 Tax=Spartinivicinus marinus TaxID=2994442 RepID=A0A853IKY6_9GAMM|nr:hypothetical protein [Spartinivicinus marinus]NYZ69735.1 hypothetical protein [Spartinivicinus marinus]